MQALMRAIYPAHCLGCRTIVGSVGGLCGPCFRETPFISGAICNLCGTPLPGEDGGEIGGCDDCMAVARPWKAGRAAMIYSGKGRGLVLGMKHGDRIDLAQPAARWMAKAAVDILSNVDLIVPIPLHWLRFVKRRQNQSALLTTALAAHTGIDHIPDLLRRNRRTPSQDGKGRDARFSNLSGALSVSARFQARIRGQRVLLVDDVMTSGATFAAGAEACLEAGSGDVFVLSLARVVKGD